MMDDTHTTLTLMKYCVYICSYEDNPTPAESPSSTDDKESPVDKANAPPTEEKKDK